MSSRPHRRDQRPFTSRVRGFTLVELLVAMALGALLLTGLANSARVFEECVEAVREQDDHTLEEGLVGITDAVRTAWLVERPSATRLDVTDAFGRKTIFRKAGSTLTVTRPSGATGVVLRGVASVAFDAVTTRRYVEAPPRVRYETWWSSPAPAGAPTTLTLRSGDQLALGFDLATAAPAAVNTVAEIQEQVLDASLDRLVVALSYFDGSSLEFCHLHASGPPHDSNHTAGSSSLSVALHESRVPGDPRPYGASLASVAMATPALPAATYQWIDSLTMGLVTPPEVIDPPSGIAWGWWNAHSEVVLEVSAPPAVDVPVDLVPMDQSVAAGRGLALVLSVVGVDFVTIEAYPLASATGSNVALKSGGAGGFTPLALAVPFRVEGFRRCTQTTAHDVVSRVTATITLQSGESVTGSALVAAQSAAGDPWTGPVPGALPVLQLAGQ